MPGLGDNAGVFSVLSVSQPSLFCAFWRHRHCGFRTLQRPIVAGDINSVRYVNYENFDEVVAFLRSEFSQKGPCSLPGSIGLLVAFCADPGIAEGTADFI